MSSRVVNESLPFNAASDIPGFAPVKLFGASAGVRTVVGIATTNEEPIGITGESGAPGGRAITVYPPGQIMRGIAGATITSGGDIGVVGATTVAGASGNYSQPLLGPVSGASGGRVWRLGSSVQPVVPGQVFSFYVNPRQLSGLA